MQASSKAHPCPVCGRTKDGDCRSATDLILCHTGTDLRPGDTITIDGQRWAFIRHNAGFSGGDALFRPHREGQQLGHGRNTLNLEAKVKRSTISFQITTFLDHFQQCWDINDFHALAPSDLRSAFHLIEHTAAEGLTLSRSLAPIWRQYPDLADLYRWRVESCCKSLRHQLQDAAHFRSHYLGEVAA